jgi:hypothetical protein
VKETELRYGGKPSGDPEESRTRIEQMREGMAMMTRRVFVVAVRRARA